MKIRDTVYHPDFNSVECMVCGNCLELSNATCSNPETLMQVREQYEIDHAQCHTVSALEIA